MSLSYVRIKSIRSMSWVDICLLLGMFVFIYALLGVAHEWAGPYRPKTEIDLSFLSLLRYALFSLVRVFLAYLLSLAFTLGYGYWAAKSKNAEPILIPLLDILQSVPVLGFMPGLVLALVHVFPRSNLGLELAAVVMIFTGEGWNMVFSFYSSLKAVPQELREVSALFRLSKREMLRSVELPYAMNGLLWNSMLSMAGGWFFLMVIESFSLGDQDFRLPGIGSYMAVAYERHNVSAVVAGITVMFVLIALVDRCLWAPLVVWSERFRFDFDTRVGSPDPLVLRWFKRSRLLPKYYRILQKVTKTLEKKAESQRKKITQRLHEEPLRPYLTGFKIFFFAIGVFVLVWGVRSMYHLLSATPLVTWLYHIRNTLFTFLRITTAVIFGSLWTIPLGVFIGTHPRWTRGLQPLVQVVASFPAPMLFPMITFFLVKCGISLEIGAIVLLLFASQWYILFNVIAGATQIPQQMLDLAGIFRVRGVEGWKAIILPAIFPSLVNGWITAAGGAWNACIVSEFVQYGGSNLVATGIGASITQAAQAADFPNLAAGIVVMVTTVVVLNRFLWGGLYRLAETRYRME